MGAPPLTQQFFCPHFPDTPLLLKYCRPCSLRSSPLTKLPPISAVVTFFDARPLRTQSEEYPFPGAAFESFFDYILVKTFPRSSEVPIFLAQTDPFGFELCLDTPFMFFFIGSVVFSTPFLFTSPHLPRWNSTPLFPPQSASQTRFYRLRVGSEKTRLRSRQTSPPDFSPSWLF